MASLYLFNPSRGQLPHGPTLPGYQLNITDHGLLTVNCLLKYYFKYKQKIIA